MARALGTLITLCVLVAGCYGACKNVKTSYYSSSDALLSTETVFIVGVSADCGESLSSLHALVNDQLLPVAKTLGANQYQVSWTEKHDKSKSGMRTINFYDDEGTTAVRKYLRYGGEEVAAKPVFSVDVDHRGVRDRLWLAPSFIAVVISVLVWWLAYTTKNKLQE